MTSADGLNFHLDSQAKYTEWQRNAPNNASEDCGTIKDNGRWNDIGCYRRLYYICELPGK